MGHVYVLGVCAWVMYVWVCDGQERGSKGVLAGKTDKLAVLQKSAGPQISMHSALVHRAATLP